MNWDNLREKVNSVASQLDKDCLGTDDHQNPITAYTFLCGTLNDFLTSQSEERVLTDTIRHQHNCHVTLQTMNKVLRKHRDVFVTLCNADSDWPADTSIKLSLDILKNDSFPIDCRCNAAIHIAEILSLYHQWESPASWIRLVFPNFGPLSSATPLHPIPDLADVTLTSHLCLVYGCLSTFDAQLLNQDVPDAHDSFLLDVLLPDILSCINRSHDVTNRLLSAKCLVLWTNNTRYAPVEFVSEIVKTVALPRRLDGSSDTLQCLLQFVWSVWEDQIDMLRSYAKDIFENVIQIHLLYTKSADKGDQFINKVLDTLVLLDWSVKAKYALIGYMSQLVKADDLFERHPNMADCIITAMKEQSLACYGSDLYRHLCLADHSDVNHWCQRWINPVLSVLYSNDKRHKQNIVEYIVPQLLKLNKGSLGYMVTHLTHSAGLYNSPTTIGAVVTCVRRARTLGLLPDVASSSDHGLFGGIVDVDTVQQALTSADQQVRLEALYLVCENKKITELLSPQECHLMLYFMQYNSNSQCPAFRQKFTSATKKFMRRFQESARGLSRDITKGGVRQHGAEQTLHRYQTFLDALMTQLFERLYPSASPPRLSTALTNINTIVMEILPHRHIHKVLKIDNIWSRKNISKLVECLTDSFEDTKRAALTVLKSLPAHAIQLPSDNVKSLLDCGLGLSESCKPHDCTTAAYIFKFLLLQVAMDDVRPVDAETCLTRGMVEIGDSVTNDTRNQHTHDVNHDTRITSNQILAKPKENITSCKDIHHDSIVNGKEKTSSKYATDFDKSEACTEEHVDKAEDLVKDIRQEQPYGEDSDKCSTCNLDVGGNRVVNQSSCDHDNERRCCMLVSTLLTRLHDQIAVAGCSLLKAAATRPMYPTLHCVRHLIACVDLRKVTKKDAWRNLLAECIRLCLVLSDLVSPVVQNSSPEGNIPQSIVRGLADEMDAGTTVSDANKEEKSEPNATRDEKSPSAVGAKATPCLRLNEQRSRCNEDMVVLMPEYLMVCCWRSVKEISLFLGEIIGMVPIEDREDQGLVSHAQVLLMGEYFTKQLMQSIHRGAFELAYAGFVKFTIVLWRAGPALRQLPSQWLETALRDIQLSDPGSRLCATRRSAGIPFYIQAILNTEPSLSGRPSLKAAMTVLLDVSMTSGDHIDTSSAKVHSMNILRAIYRDTKLGEDMSPYIADGFRVTILGFTDKTWAIRNCATLLFSTLMTRTFGVKRSRDESSLSRKNCMSSYAFFQRYPDLHDFLLVQIAEATRCFRDHSGQATSLQPAIYPILLILSRIFPSSIAGCPDDNRSLQPFIPYIISCARSPILKTRQMAAVALQSLVSESQVIHVLRDLMAWLPKHPGLATSHNLLHGRFLQIQSLLSSMRDTTLSDHWSEMIDDFIQASWTMTRRNHCKLTKQCAMETSCVLLKILEKQENVSKKYATKFKTLLLKNSLEELYATNEPCGVTLCESHVKMAACKMFLLTVCSMMEETFPIDLQVSKDSNLSPWSKTTLLENVLVKIVKSQVYELQIMILTCIQRTLSNSSRKFQTESTCCTEQISVSEALSGDQRELLAALCRDSQMLFEEILALLFSAKHFEVMENTMYALSELVTSVPFPWMVKNRGYTCEEVWQHVLSIAANCPRDDIKCASLHFTGRLLPHLMSSPNIASTTCINPWVSLIVSSTAAEESTEIHMAVARVLAANAAILLIDRTDVLGILTFDLWDAVVTLHNAQDSDVRETITQVLNNISPTPDNVSVQSSRSFDLLIGRFIDVTFPYDAIRCCQTLLKWMTEADEMDESEDERLFDRGEMNTYRESVVLCDVVSRHLTQLLHALGYDDPGVSARQQRSTVGRESDGTICLGDEVNKQHVHHTLDDKESMNDRSRLQTHHEIIDTELDGETLGDQNYDIQQTRLQDHNTWLTRRFHSDKIRDYKTHSDYGGNDDVNVEVGRFLVAYSMDVTVMLREMLTMEKYWRLSDKLRDYSTYATRFTSYYRYIKILDLLAKHNLVEDTKLVTEVCEAFNRNFCHKT